MSSQEYIELSSRLAHISDEVAAEALDLHLEAEKYALGFYPETELVKTLNRLTSLKKRLKKVETDWIRITKIKVD